MTIEKRDTMGGLAKGLAVIETFAADRPRQSIAEVAAAAGLDRATARRCLLTLAQLGYADWDGKYFTLTPRVLRLGTACLATMPLPQIVQPLLDELSDRIGESSSVSILDGPEIVYVARAAQRRVMTIALMPGSRLPAYCTSMGRAMLAALPEDAARRLLEAAPRPSRTPRTLTDVDAILAAIAEVRRLGYAVNDQEVEIGLRSIAVPLVDARGRVVAAMNIGLAVAAGTDDLAARYLPELLRARDALRRLLP
ncbi:IclR family transcriptional regulator domain-containing protein [Oharaeibacter diazotrophicus]|uniref:IclR family transcriptional regulator n=1 Tax=Oharaeibacter diazotrophicus TaxID=1920512 RepID=A0A4R6RG86_9HYPH|nr:IclR family transcriptional regulator C-terminal domain-containing protein [Oharaeibacter diazotrophicus]TDP85441.1 IclR family transcriptional regulator [Oharaeibacter diazotrophicus]BBE74411.1 Pca regulon regulatory protein [Pleomorphomonas sp. SM30]GLS75893.1 IclR family transcriptional regulator [Oharaeibacter diazotrophicus]